MKIFCYLIVIFSVAINLVQADEPVVIANSHTTVTTISSDTATQIFLKKIRTWPDGKAIQPIDLDENSAVRTDFYTKVIKRSPAQVRAYWARQVFTGMGFPPQQVHTEAEADAFVSKTQGAIGYVGKANTDGSVKIVLDPN